MSLPARMLFFTAGLYAVFLARTQLKTGHSVFANASYHQMTFAAAGFGVGAILILLALLPPGDWVYRRITTKKPKPKFLQKH